MDNIKNIEKLVYKSAKAINEIATKDGYNKTDCLNANYHCGKIHAYLELLEILDFDKFVTLHEETQDYTTKAMEITNKLYK